MFLLSSITSYYLLSSVSTTVNTFRCHSWLSNSVSVWFSPIFIRYWSSLEIVKFQMARRTLQSSPLSVSQPLSPPGSTQTSFIVHSLHSLDRPEAWEFNVRRLDRVNSLRMVTEQFCKNYCISSSDKQPKTCLILCKVPPFLCEWATPKTPLTRAQFLSVERKSSFP